MKIYIVMGGLRPETFIEAVYLSRDDALQEVAIRNKHSTLYEYWVESKDVLQKCDISKIEASYTAEEWFDNTIETNYNDPIQRSRRYTGRSNI